MAFALSHCRRVSIYGLVPKSYCSHPPSTPLPYHYYPETSPIKLAPLAAGKDDLCAFYKFQAQNLTHLFSTEADFYRILAVANLVKIVQKPSQ